MAASDGMAPQRARENFARLPNGAPNSFAITRDNNLKLMRLSTCDVLLVGRFIPGNTHQLDVVTGVPNTERKRNPMQLIVKRPVTLHSQSTPGGLIHFEPDLRTLTAPDDCAQHPGFDMLVQGGIVVKIEPPRAGTARGSAC